jgi:hypothetical protein
MTTVCNFLTANSMGEAALQGLITVTPIVRLKCTWIQHTVAAILQVDNAMRSCDDAARLQQLRQEVLSASNYLLQMIYFLGQDVFEACRHYEAAYSIITQIPNSDALSDCMKQISQALTELLPVFSARLEDVRRIFVEFVGFCCQNGGLTVPLSEVHQIALEPTEVLQTRLVQFAAGRYDEVQRVFPPIASRHYDVLVIKNILNESLSRATGVERGFDASFRATAQAFAGQAQAYAGQVRAQAQQAQLQAQQVQARIGAGSTTGDACTTYLKWRLIIACTSYLVFIIVLVIAVAAS